MDNGIKCPLIVDVNSYVNHTIATYDLHTIHSIINETPVLHVRIFAVMFPRLNLTLNPLRHALQNLFSRHLTRLAIRPHRSKTDSEIITQVSFNSSDSEDPFPAVLPMIGTMGSFAYPSADLNDPLYVLFGAIRSFLAANPSHMT